MRNLIALAAALIVGVSSDALALCGDVNGDDKRTTTDALAVLRSAVGQNVELTCPDAGPSRLRYYNDFTCTSGSSVSQAMFNGFEFEADATVTSPYQTVDRTSINDMEISLCGGTYSFAGPANLPFNRSISFFMVLADPAVYDFGTEVPAFFVLYDDGEPATTAAALPEYAPEHEIAVMTGGAMHGPQ